MTKNIQTAQTSKTILPNGLTILSENLPAYRSVAVGVWIKTGSRYENTNDMGLVHFIEHMLFKGTRSRTALQIARELEELGGSINAFTGKEETCFYAHILDSHLNKGIEVLGDMVCNSLFEEKDIEIEKQVVLEEIKAVKDTPEEYIFDIFQEKIFPDQPMGFPILGKNRNVRNLHREQIISFFKRFYIPSNIVVAAAGKVEHKVLVDLVQNSFNVAPGDGLDEVQPVSAKISTNTHFAIKKRLNQSHVCIGGKAVSYFDQTRFDLIALNTYLGSGLSSVLFQVLREELGYVYSVYSFLDFYRDAGLIGFYLGTDQKNRKYATERLYQELAKLTKRNLDTGQVEMLKEQMKGNFFLSLESTFKRMTRLAKNEIYYGKLISFDELIQFIDRISPNSINKAAQLYLNEKSLNSVIMTAEKIDA